MIVRPTILEMSCSNERMAGLGEKAVCAPRPVRFRSVSNPRNRTYKREIIAGPCFLNDLGVASGLEVDANVPHFCKPMKFSCTMLKSWIGTMKLTGAPDRLPGLQTFGIWKASSVMKSPRAS